MLSRFVSVIVFLFVLPVLAGAQQVGFPLEEKLTAETRSVSEAINIDPQNVRILDRQEVTLPNLETKFKLIKFLDTSTGNSWGLALDDSNAVVDYEELLAEERSLHYQTYGSMQVELYRVVEEGDQDTIPVLIKLNVPEKRIDKSRFHSKMFSERGSEAEAQEVMKRLKQRTAKIFSATLGELELEIPGQISQSGPFVSTQLSPDAIIKLSRDPRIAFIGLDKEEIVLDYPTIPQSLPTTRTNKVHSYGTKGVGVKIAVLESGGLTENQCNFNISAIEIPGAPPDSHMTRSVAIIGNRYNNGLCNGIWEGYAPDATVLIANHSDYTQAYDWAKTQGANVITMSWHYLSEETAGGLHSRDIFFDYAATHYPYPSVFTSAGNGAPGDYASGKGYNFFGVANILNDGDGNRCNDAISTSSSWKNPTSPHGDREVPEIASPGSRHELLDTSFGGTSAATPVTASIAALLMSKNNDLKIWPEAIRAILAATANYQDGDGSNWSKYSDGKDGTGMTNSRYAYYTAGKRETTDTSQFRAHDYGSMRDSDFTGGFFNKTWKAYTTTTSSRIRVALTWNSKTDLASSVLDADLDLLVYDPDMNLVAWSTSWDDNLEFVEFVPVKTGDYTIKIRGFSVPVDFWNYYGIAWTTHYDVCP